MFNRMLVFAIVSTLTIVACDKTAGRPAPNSQPISQAPQPARNQQYPPQTNNSNNPTHTANTGTTAGTPPKPLTGLPPKIPGQTPNLPGQNPSQTTSSRIVQFDNASGPMGETIMGESFFVDNFDSVNMPRTRFSVVENLGPGQSRRLNGKDLTHLSDNRYLSCATPDCIRQISTIEDYDRFAKTCWVKTLSTEVAKFEFSFGANGNLRFIAEISGVLYGAKNIGYNFDGKNKLSIDPFIAASVINGKENRALMINGIPFNAEQGDGIHVALRNPEGGGRNPLKSIMTIDAGTLKQGRFVSNNSMRRYVGSTIAQLKPIEATHFRVFDVQE
jgi:hypothetical protein